MPVISLILGLRGTPGSHRRLSSSTICPFSSLTAPTSMMRSMACESPVVSKSSTTMGPSMGRSSASVTMGTRSHRYPSTPGMSLMPCFLAAPKAAGKACALPWSVMATAGWPHLAACAMSTPASAVASMVDMVVCMCSSMRFSAAVSMRSILGICCMSRTLTDNSFKNGSMRQSPLRRTRMPFLI